MFPGRIDIYPIKSLDGVSLPRVRVGQGGILENDRIFAIVDSSGSYVNGKRTDRIHLIRTLFDSDFREGYFRIQGEAQGQNFVLREPDRINRWLSEFFGFAVQLIGEPLRGFADDHQASGPTIVSEASLNETVRWFTALSLEHARRRFRSNLEIGGVQPFWEDRLFGAEGQVRSFRVGNVSFNGHNPCQRCVVPSRDPDSGVQPEPGFQKTFMALRKRSLPSWANPSRFNHYYRFAVNTSIPVTESGKWLDIGDPIYL